MTRRILHALALVAMAVALLAGVFVLAHRADVAQAARAERAEEIREFERATERRSLVERCNRAGGVSVVSDGQVACVERLMWAREVGGRR